MASALAVPSLFDEAVSIPATVRDLGSFRDWMHSEDFPRHLRATYVRGEILIEMNAQEISTHALAKGHLYLRLGGVIEQDDLGHLLPDPTLFVNEEADVSNEPDLMFVSWDSLRDGLVEYRERKAGSERLIEVVGSPDMVAEIVSDSSVSKDSVKLFQSYFDAGVREYWLIDARAEEVEFHIFVRGVDGFESAKLDDNGFRRSPVFERDFRLDREIDPVGMYRYRLESRRS